jgi:hypothetical protein
VIIETHEELLHFLATNNDQQFQAQQENEEKSPEVQYQSQSQSGSKDVDNNNNKIEKQKVIERIEDDDDEVVEIPVPEKLPAELVSLDDTEHAEGLVDPIFDQQKNGNVRVLLLL